MRRGIDFDTIYATDLVYVPNCWKLCGNAHCCNFSRSKQRFRLIGGQPSQELPLLPGERDYLAAKGFLRQFGDHDVRAIEYPFGGRRLRIETIVSRREGCACDHETRPAVCRLYPLLPLVDFEGRLIGVERLGVYDLLETLSGEERICQVSSLPFGEVEKLLTIVAAITRSPLGLLYLKAYAAAQQHLSRRLVELKGNREASFYSVFEGAMFRGRLIHHEQLAGELAGIADAIEATHGPLSLA